MKKIKFLILACIVVLGIFLNLGCLGSNKEIKVESEIKQPEISSKIEANNSADMNASEPPKVIEKSLEYSPLDFAKIPAPILISDKFLFTEGPAWDIKNDRLLFSDIEGNKIYELKLPNKINIYRTPSNNSNGLDFDNQGNLYVAEHGSRSVTLLLSDGQKKILSERYMGKKLNSPNDIVSMSDGTIYFTDPTFGLKGQKELDFMGLYRLTKDGSLILEDKFDNSPNGVSLSPDEKKLYLSLTFGNEVLVYDLSPDGSTKNPRKFASVNKPDGVDIDVAGNLYVAGLEGIYVFAPDSTKLGIIYTEDQPTNCEFGGHDGNILFVTARNCLYRVDMPIPGIKE